MLIVLGGLPGVGKTTVARSLARRLGAIHLRVDTIEQALRSAGHDVTDQGYRVAYALAEDHLLLGSGVIADCVNPWPLTREAWRSVASRAHARSLDVEIVCSDPAEHRRRVETRASDIPSHRLPTWDDVVARDYRGWDRDRLVIDTAVLSVDEAVDSIVAAVRQGR